MNTFTEENTKNSPYDMSMGPHIYFSYDKNEIITHQIYFEVKNLEAKLSRDLVIEFRERLESFLFSKRVISVKFHPLQWRYFANYFRQQKETDWRNEKNPSVFYPTFFLQDSRFTGETTLDSLTDDEKIQIVAPKRNTSHNNSSFGEIFNLKTLAMEPQEEGIPLQGPIPIHGDFLLKPVPKKEEEYFENLTSERRQEILEKLNRTQYRVYVEDSDSPYQWHRWAFDIYSLDTPYRVSFKEDRSDFEYFFAWKLALTDFKYVKLFLDWHFRETFDEDITNFKEFVSLLLMKYDYIIQNKFIPVLTTNFLDELKLEDINDIKKVVIPAKVNRESDDNMTSLTSEQTAILIQLHQEAGIMLKDDPKLLSKESAAKALKVLTGYGIDNMSKNLGKITFNKLDLEKTKAALEKMIVLVDRKLKK